MNQKQDPAINLKVLLLSAIISCATIFTAYVSLAQNPVFGVKKVTLAVVVWFLVAGGYYALIQRFILKFLGHSSIKNLPVFLVLGLSSLFFCLFVPGRLAFFVPHTVTITPLPEAAGLPDKQIVILGLHNGDTHVSHKTIQAVGSWEYRAVRFTAFSSAASPLVWQGRSNRQIRVELLTGPNMGSAVLDADGSRTTVNLNAPGESAASVPLEVHIPFTLKLAYSLCSFIAFYAAQLAFVSLLAYFQKKQGKIPAALFFPVVFLFLTVIPLFFLLIYFPGIISGDSIVQFQQIRSSMFTNWVPFFHTIVVIAAMKIWNSPAAVSVFQILLFAAIFTGLIRFLIRHGLSQANGLVFALLASISLTNAIFLISPWKDVLYGLSLASLSVLLYQIVKSDGTLMDSWLFNITFGVNAIFVVLTRHNGFPIIIITFTLLYFIYKRHPRFLLALFIPALFVGTFNLWVLPAFKVEKAPANFRLQPFMYQISAHIQAGTAMSNQEKALLEGWLPAQDWEYDPCSSKNLTWYTHPVMSVGNRYLSEHYIDFIILYGKLFLRDPLVNIRHMLASTTYIYRLQPVCHTMIAPLLYKSESSIGAEWIDTPDSQVRQDSRLPVLVKPFTRFLSLTFDYSDLRLGYIVFWRPALWLLAAVFSVLLAALCAKNWKMMVVLLPALVQSAVLFVINVANIIRYQYGIALIAQAAILILLFEYLIHTQKSDLPG